MDIPVVTNFRELYEAIECYAQQRHFIFRGQADNWPLLPKGWREGFAGKDEELFYSWRRQAVSMFGGPRLDSYWDWMSLAQHHGLATRFLDWTLNPLVAAFFATDSAASANRDGFIYAARFRSRARVDENDALIQGGPFSDLGGRIRLIWPNRVAARISAQAGLFTLHGDGAGIRFDGAPISGQEAIQPSTPDLDYFQQFRIPAAAKDSLRRELSFIGVHVLSIYPDLDGLSEYLNWGVQTNTYLQPGEYFGPATG